MSPRLDQVAEATPPAQAGGETKGHPPDINSLFQESRGLLPKDARPGVPSFDPGDLTLTGLTPLSPAKPPGDSTGGKGDTTPANNVPSGPGSISDGALINAGGGGGASSGNAADTTDSANTADRSQPTKAPDVHESTAWKVGREVVVVGGGLGRSVIYGMASIPERIPELTTSAAMGATLSNISKTGEFGTAATLIVGTYFTSRFLVNAFNDTNRWNKLGSALSDTWHSGANMGKDIRDVSESGGNFAFDTGVSYAAGYVGFKNKALADALIDVFKFPVPAPLPGPGIPPRLPFSPALVGATPFLTSVPAPFLFKHHRDDVDDKKSDNK